MPDPHDKQGKQEMQGKPRYPSRDALAQGLAAEGCIRLREPLMGTDVSVELWHADREEGMAAAQAVMAEYHRINTLMSTYIEDSEISRLNREAAQAPFVVGPELFEVVTCALQLARLSGGCFDITYDSVGSLYDLRAGIVPDEQARRTAQALIDYRDIELDAQRRSIRFGRPGMRINLGGIGKGYAVERGAAILRQRGVRHALLNAGGDSRVVGDRRGQPWIIGVRDPRAADAVIARLPLVDEAISTAGDYERCFDRDGVRWHHILDPATGLPSRGIRSVTVIGPDATMTDGLDTAIFIMGVEKGMALIGRLDGYEAIVVDDAGKLFYSRGLQAP
jgi:thiamine biosynthesis lipoprotein